jgi:hypothetical protein
MFQSGEYTISYDVHLHLSKPGRFFVRHHSGTLAIVDTKTKNLKALLMQKLDFGAALYRISDKPYRIGLRPEEQKLNDELKAAGRIPMSRLFNVLNGLDRSKLTPKQDYREGAEFSVGRYEQWSSTFVCGSAGNDSLFKVDTRDPATAIKYANSSLLDPMTQLGRFPNGNTSAELVPSISSVRRLIATNYKISTSQCPPGAAKVAAERDGVFYTDPYAQEVFSEPGESRMRQFIQPGFSVTIDGEFAVDDKDPHDLYERPRKESNGRIKDFMNAIDWTEN